MLRLGFVTKMKMAETTDQFHVGGDWTMIIAMDILHTEYEMIPILLVEYSPKCNTFRQVYVGEDRSKI